MEWLPAAVSTETAIILTLVSYFTSAAAAAFGLGGGVIMIAVMASLLPPFSVIPVHGAVQIGSNGGRALVMRRHVVRPVLLWFAAGTLLGAAAGSQLVTGLPGGALQLMIGLFALWSAWAPAMARRGIRDRLFLLVGLGSTLATLFIGSTGPLIAAFLSPARIGRHGMVATQGACMTLQHLIKIPVFGLLGFAFAAWLPLIAAMTATGFLGTLTGKALLDRLPEIWFRRLFRLLLTLLALRLLHTGLTDLL